MQVGTAEFFRVHCMQQNQVFNGIELSQTNDSRTMRIDSLLTNRTSYGHTTGGKRTHYGQDTGKIQTIDRRRSRGDRPTPGF